jgi:hypothetical protein
MYASLQAHKGIEMKSIFAAVVVLIVVAALAPGLAQAQPVLAQRCAMDSLSASQAEARANWARRCALVYRVNDPNAWYGPMEYDEYDPDLNFWGQNSWIGVGSSFQINYSTKNLLYLSGATIVLIDALGYYRWESVAARKRPRPFYPTYGSHHDIHSPSSVQMFPHPTDLTDCFFYLDRAGTVPAVGSAFHVNGFCEPSSALMAQELGVREEELDEPSLFQKEELDIMNRIERHKAIPSELIPH